MTSTIEKLVDAEAKALQLFQTIETRKLIEAGKSEKHQVKKYLLWLLSFSG